MEAVDKTVVETTDKVGHDPVNQDDLVEKQAQDKSHVDRDKERALEDLKKIKAQNVELLEALKKKDEAIEESRLAKLKEQEKFQELAETWQQKAQDAEQKASGLEKSMIYAKKFDAVKTAALQAGIKKEAIDDLEMLDFGDVDIEYTSTGRVNVLGAGKFVENIKITRPHWFGKKGASVNPSEPGVVGSSSIKYADLLKAEEQAKKTGDYATYSALHKKYVQQLRNG